MHNVSNRDDAPSLGEVAVRQDDFSLQASLPQDPKFWVRVERELYEYEGGRTVRVTDLTPGGQSADFVGRVLAELLRAFSAVDQIEVFDIYPGWEQDPRFEVELERRISEARDCLAVALMCGDRPRLELRRDRGKYTAIARVTAH